MKTKTYLAAHALLIALQVEYALAHRPRRIRVIGLDALERLARFGELFLALPDAGICVQEIVHPLILELQWRARLFWLTRRSAQAVEKRSDGSYMNFDKSRRTRLPAPGCTAAIPGGAATPAGRPGCPR